LAGDGARGAVDGDARGHLVARGHGDRRGRTLAAAAVTGGGRAASRLRALARVRDANGRATSALHRLAVGTVRLDGSGARLDDTVDSGVPDALAVHILHACRVVVAASERARAPNGVLALRRGARRLGWAGGGDGASDLAAAVASVDRRVQLPGDPLDALARARRGPCSAAAVGGARR